jgi:nucleoside-diphosphate-sugar epimerase
MLTKIKDHFAGKKILITGGNGFIASHLARRLCQLGAIVRLLDLHNSCATECEFVLADVRDYGALKRAASQCDVIFHLAACLGVEKILDRPKEVMDVNLLGTINALKAAKLNEVKCFVFTSSSEVYGEPQRIPVSESAPPSPISTYGVSKLAAETYCRAYAHTDDLKVTCLRLFNVYGPGQTAEFVVPRFIRCVIEGLPPVIYGDGRQIRAYTYVSDAIDCMLLSVLGQNETSEVFNVGSTEVANVTQLAQEIIQISGRHLTPVYKALGDGIRSARREIYNRVPDVSKAKRLLGFKSRVSLSDGLTRCYEWSLLSCPRNKVREWR